MTSHFHMTLNRMAFFTAFLAVVLIFFWPQFLSIAISNVILNGIIIGTGLFGIGLAFYEMFKLLPEYRWLSAYLHGDKNAPLPPLLLRPMALMLHTRPKQIPTQTLQGFLDMIMVRFEDSRESIRYITNTLIFLGLLGTFWGLIVTVGGFSELLTSLDFSSESVLNTMQAGLSRPLSGMATAFTSSLLGLASSLSVGFLGLQVQLAQNAIFRELEDYLSEHAQISDDESIPQINFITRELSRIVEKMDKQK